MIGARGIACVKGEIHNVLTTIDGSSSTVSSIFFESLLESTTSDTIILSRALQDLHDQLGFYNDISSVEVTMFTRPFLGVIKSQSVSWQASAASLQAIHKFLLYGLISPTSLQASVAMNECISSLAMVTSRVTAHRPQRDLLQLRVLELFLEFARCNAGVLLTNDSLCLIFEEMFALRQNPSANLLLVTYADDVIGQFILVVFVRLCNRRHDDLHRPVNQSCIQLHIRGSSDISNLAQVDVPVHKPSGYDANALVRILKFIAALIDPSNSSLEVRLLGLRLINICLETAGSGVAEHAALVAVVQDDICKQILQNSQTADNSILALVLRIVFDLFAVMRRHIRVQLEVFFTSIHIRIASNPAAPSHQRELVLQSIVELCHEPDLLIGLYRNYDCEIASTNMFEDLIRMLNQLASPDTVVNSPSRSIDQKQSPGSGPCSAVNLIALESLIAVVASIARRFSTSSNDGDDSEVEANLEPDSNTDDANDELVSNRRTKIQLKRAAALFNELGHKAIPQIQALGALPPAESEESVVSPTAMARFIRETPGLDRRVVGNYLGRNDKNSIAVLSSYVDLFELEGLGFVEGLRTFMESFVIPGEAQMISRIMEEFARRYYGQNPSGPISDQDAAFILSFSVIMLNTDAHNPGVKSKMTLEQFMRNNRGINNGKDFPEEFLTSVYNEIVGNEIRIVSECLSDVVDSSGDGGVNPAYWEHLVRQSRDAAASSFHVSAGHIHGKAMFKIMRSNFAHLVAWYLESVSDPKVTQRIVEGCHLYARICVIYDIHAPFNTLIISLCRSLISMFREICNNMKGYSVKYAFGLSSRAHRSLLLLFNLVLSYGHRCLCEAWVNVLHVVLWLRQMDLLPDTLGHMDDIRDTNGKFLPSLREAHNVVPERPRKSLAAAIFSSLWIVESDTDSNHDEEKFDESSVDEEAECIRIGREAVSSCNIDQVFFMHRRAVSHPDSLQHLVRTLIALSANPFSADPSAACNLENFDMDVLNEDSAVFCLERLSNIVDNNAELLIEKDIWSIIFQHFKAILASVTSEPSFYMERIIVNLLRLCVGGNDRVINDAISLLPTLASFPIAVQSSLSERTALGLSLLFRANISSIPLDVFPAICDSLASTRFHPRAFATCMETLEYLSQQVLSPSYTSTLSHIYLDIVRSPGAFVRPAHAVHLLLLLNRSICRFHVSDSTSKRSPLSTASSSTIDISEFQDLWMDNISSMCHACACNSDVKSQVYAIECLQECLLTDLPFSSSPFWIDCYDQHLLPLFGEIVDNDVKVRVCNLLFKTLLQRMEAITEGSLFLSFWPRFVESTTSIALGDGFYSQTFLHFRESMKNILLFFTKSSRTPEAPVNSVLELSFAVLRRYENLDSFCEEIVQEIHEDTNLNTNREIQADEIRDGNESGPSLDVPTDKQ
uniref:SEC7 domain-containing protein n=1 Tax=Spongospora subterranea TaxID=70186 RepID=A0A0H5R846_9EUKA|eukprot:CRZ10006.1 hypothetical protein [Spongospora subterranea]